MAYQHFGSREAFVPDFDAGVGLEYRGFSVPMVQAQEELARFKAEGYRVVAHQVAEIDGVEYLRGTLERECRPGEVRPPDHDITGREKFARFVEIRPERKG